MALFLMLLFLSSNILWAHPGPHNEGFIHTLRHFLSDPYHIMITILTFVTGFAIAAWFLKGRAKKTID